MLAAALLFSSGCDNYMAKHWGGTMKVDLQCGQKLFDITWKDDNFWYATRSFRDGEFPEEYVFHAKSEFGMMEGSVIIKECR